MAFVMLLSVTDLSTAPAAANSPTSRRVADHQDTTRRLYRILPDPGDKAAGA